MKYAVLEPQVLRIEKRLLHYIVGVLLPEEWDLDHRGEFDDDQGRSLLEEMDKMYARRQMLAKDLQHDPEEAETDQIDDGDVVRKYFLESDTRTQDTNPDVLKVYGFEDIPDTQSPSKWSEPEIEE